MTAPNTNLLINPLSSAYTPLQSQTAASGTSLNDSFSQILSTSLLSGGMGSSEASGSLFGGGSSGAMSLLLPLMLMLLEQITAQQSTQNAEEEQTSTTFDQAVAATQATQSTADTTDESGATGDNAEPIGRPVGGVITQYFHKRHYGLDFGVPVGTPVKSTQAGQVVYSGWNNEGYGNLVIVENGPYRTYYGHLSSLPMQVGDTVNAGQVIGYSGNTGNSTGPHLHYEIRINRSPIDPTSRTLNSGVTW